MKRLWLITLVTLFAACSNPRSTAEPTSVDIAAAPAEVEIQLLSVSDWHAQLDPLKRQERPYVPELDPAHYGLTEADMNVHAKDQQLPGEPLHIIQ